MKTAYGGTHFFLVGMAPTGMAPAQRMIAIRFGGNINPSAVNLCVATVTLSYRGGDYRRRFFRLADKK
jgi:hypothetical protein